MLISYLQTFAHFIIYPATVLDGKHDYLFAVNGVNHVPVTTGVRGQSITTAGEEGANDLSFAEFAAVFQHHFARRGIRRSRTFPSAGDGNVHATIMFPVPSSPTLPHRQSDPRFFRLHDLDRPG